MAGCFDSDLGNEFAGLAITDCAWFLGFGPGFDLITLPVDVINGTGAGLAGAGAAALDLRRFRTHRAHFHGNWFEVGSQTETISNWSLSYSSLLDRSQSG